jgi:hypothetical protein
MEVLLTEDREVVEAVLDRIEIAVRRFPRDLIARAPNLRWYQQWVRARTSPASRDRQKAGILTGMCPV